MRSATHSEVLDTAELDHIAPAASSCPRVFRIGKIGDLHHALAMFDAAEPGLRMGTHLLSRCLGECHRHAAHCHRVKNGAVIGAKRPAGGLTQPHGFVEHRIEHRRKVAGRGVDDLQYLGGRGLLSERLVALRSAFGKLALQIGYALLGIG